MAIVRENDFVKYTLDNEVLHLKVKKSHPTDEEWEFAKQTICSFYDAADKANLRFALIFELLEMGMLKLVQIREWANIFIERRDMTKKIIISSAMITNNSLVNVSLNSFLAMYETSRPTRVVTNYQEAIDFVNNHK